MRKENFQFYHSTTRKDRSRSEKKYISSLISGRKKSTTSKNFILKMNIIRMLIPTSPLIFNNKKILRN